MANSDTRTRTLKLEHNLIVLTAVMELYVTGGTLRQPWNMEDTTPFYFNVSLRLTETLRPLKTMSKVKMKFKSLINTIIFENRLRIPIFGLLCIQMSFLFMYLFIYSCRNDRQIAKSRLSTLSCRL